MVMVLVAAVLTGNPPRSGATQITRLSGLLQNGGVGLSAPTTSACSSCARFADTIDVAMQRICGTGQQRTIPLKHIDAFGIGVAA